MSRKSVQYMDIYLEHVQLSCKNEHIAPKRDGKEIYYMNEDLIRILER
jgi:hypothetical protein